jgi:serine-type D-Ala-D-Ala carboxypeptidase
VCYKPITKATGGDLLDHVTNSPLPHCFSAQEEQFQHAFAVLEDGIARRAFPGAAIAVTHRGKLIAAKGLGHFTYDPGAAQVTRETIYDLASLTKVVATTAACMLLWQTGRLHLEGKISDVLPEFARTKDSRRREVTFRQLMAHSSGLPAYVKLFATSHNRSELLEQAFQVELTASPGTRAEYSDIGFILLGEALERLVAEPLDRFCQREIYDILQLSTMAFHPRLESRAQIPPTEDDPSFRHSVIQGEVNDENAWVMGGVAGHAGCFSTAADVARFGECLLRGGAPLWDLRTVELFTRRQASPSGASRALGWDTPSPPSQSGKYFSPQSYGHLGFTGCSLWIDPERHLSVTLLTNRTWPNRGSQAIKQVRPWFHDAIIEALGE